MNLLHKFSKTKAERSIERIPDISQFCLRANEQLSKQTYEGICEAESTLKILYVLAKKSPEEDLRRFAHSAYYNVTEARKCLEKAESDYSHKFTRVLTWKEERRQIDNHLYQLHEDMTTLKHLFEHGEIKKSEGKSQRLPKNLFENMRYLRDSWPQLYGGLEGTIHLLQDAQDFGEHCSGVKLTSYERKERDIKFRLVRKITVGAVALGICGVGAVYGFYNGIHSLPYAGESQGITSKDISEFIAIGVMTGVQYTDIALQRYIPNHTKPELIIECTVFAPFAALLGHTAGYALGTLGAGIRSIL